MQRSYLCGQIGDRNPQISAIAFSIAIEKLDAGTANEIKVLRKTK